MSDIRVTPLERKHIVESLTASINNMQSKCSKALEDCDEEEYNHLNTQMWIVRGLIKNIESLGDGVLFMKNGEDLTLEEENKIMEAQGISVPERWCMCTKVNLVARDMFATCAQCNGRDAYGTSKMRPEKFKKYPIER